MDFRRMTYTLAAVAAVLLAAVVAGGCGRGHGEVPGARQAAVYYWRTSFALDSAERAFLQRHHVEKLYVRFFDVVMRGGRPMPNATVTGLDSVPPGLEVVPTVFIMENCLHADTARLARQVVRRVAQMCDTHGLRAGELQVDCDWTARSMPVFYSLLEAMRRELSQRGWRLSVTVRLHQLSMPVPPADYGVLMVYNTGDIRRPDGTNPILDARHVAPYLPQLDGYDLPLCAAYPCFSWQLLYGRDGTFKAILYDSDLADTTMFRPLEGGRYLVTRNRDLPEPNSDGSDAVWLNVGDTVVVARPSAAAILNTHDRLAGQRAGINRQVVLYSLNSKQMKQYNDSLYEKIFTP